MMESYVLPFSDVLNWEAFSIKVDLGLGYSQVGGDIEFSFRGEVSEIEGRFEGSEKAFCVEPTSEELGLHSVLTPLPEKNNVYVQIKKDWLIPTQMEVDEQEVRMLEPEVVKDNVQAESVNLLEKLEARMKKMEANVEEIRTDIAEIKSNQLKIIDLLAHRP